MAIKPVSESESKTGKWFDGLLDAAYGNRRNSKALMSEHGQEAIDSTCLDEMLRSFRGRRVLIYGAGSFGREMFRLLAQHGVRVDAFLDKKALQIGSTLGLPVHRADDRSFDGSVKETALVLFSIVLDKTERGEILGYIRQCGFENVLESQSIRCLLVYADDFGCRDIDGEYLMNHKIAITRAAQLFADDESANIYKCNVRAHASRDYSNCVESRMTEQYFPGDIELSKGFSRFVDCGGYIGDTIEALVSSQGKIETAICFEPNKDNFAMLTQTASRLSGRIDETFLYPCAVSDRTQMTSFLSNGGSSMLRDQGGDNVLSVSLDDVLKGFSPTFIKMDIEGEELSALQGARNLISRCRPDLAISVYHCINHIWEIPLLLNSWDLGYKLYLRTYNACTMETVLYGTCGN